VQRVSVIGISGSGKTTLAREIAGRLGCPHLELDSVFHQPGWTPIATEEFQRRVSEFIASDSWVTDGNYSSRVQPLIWTRADTVIWLDLPRRTVMRRVILRTLRRMSTGTELWNGNREQWRDLFTLDPDRSIIVWTWKNHRVHAPRFAAAVADPANARIRFVRLSSPAAVSQFLAAIPQDSGAHQLGGLGDHVD
jgi:adenylate kinase family enzyme